MLNGLVRLRDRHRFYLVVLVVLVLLPGCHRRETERPLPIAVEAATLRREEIASQSRFTATVREQQRIELSFKAAGTVASLLQVAGADGKLRDVHEGDEVLADPARPLIALDDADFERRLTMARDRLGAGPGPATCERGDGDGGAGELRPDEGPAGARGGGPAGLRRRAGPPRFARCRTGDGSQRGLGGGHRACNRPKTIEELRTGPADRQGDHFPQVRGKRRTRPGRASGPGGHGPVHAARPPSGARHEDRAVRHRPDDDRHGRCFSRRAVYGLGLEDPSRGRSPHAKFRDGSHDRPSARPAARDGGHADHRGGRKAWSCCP